MKIKTFIIDAFTDEPFKGNPAGVCLLEYPIQESVMQSITQELNLSETAFLVPSQVSNTDYHIRYFTPITEINFCGHATLAASKLVLDYLGESEVKFTTKYNLHLSAIKQDKYIKMIFPLYRGVDYEIANGLLKALNISNPKACHYVEDLEMLILEIDSVETLKNLSPDYQALLMYKLKLQGIIITTSSQDKYYDFYSRCFCPWIGINEDPVTGAAHSALAHYWADKLEKRELKAYQLSQRGGFLNLKILNEQELEVYSNAQIVLNGEINVQD